MAYGVVPALATGLAPRIAAEGILSTAERLLAAMFLHGGLMHLLGNMWYLWIFGDNIEDRLGHGGFLLFYFACGLVASVAQIVVNATSISPMIGASGAIAGVLGAYLMCFPRARVTTLIPPIFLIRLPAALVLGGWFLIQLLQGTAGIATGGGGVAWWAHIGGFVAGVAMIRFIPCRQKSRQSRYRVSFDRGRKIIDVDP